MKLYDERYPFAAGPGYYALFMEDPDRIKLEIVAPAGARIGEVAREPETRQADRGDERHGPAR